MVNTPQKYSCTPVASSSAPNPRGPITHLALREDTKEHTWYIFTPKHLVSLLTSQKCKPPVLLRAAQTPFIAVHAVAQPWTWKERNMVYVGTEGSRRILAPFPSLMKSGKTPPITPMGWKGKSLSWAGSAACSCLLPGCSDLTCWGPDVQALCSSQSMEGRIWKRMLQCQDSNFVSWHPALKKGEEKNPTITSIFRTNSLATALKRGGKTQMAHYS